MAISVVIVPFSLILFFKSAIAWEEDSTTCKASGIVRTEPEACFASSLYDTDLKNYGILCLGKKIYDTDFYNSVLNNLPAWVEQMAKAYGDRGAGNGLHNRRLYTG